MAPQVVVADEIGNIGDVEAVKYAMCCGVKGIFTAHGGSVQEIKLNPELKKMIEGNMLQKIVFLKNKGIEEILDIN